MFLAACRVNSIWHVPTKEFWEDSMFSGNSVNSASNCWLRTAETLLSCNSSLVQEMFKVKHCNSAEHAIHTQSWKMLCKLNKAKYTQHIKHGSTLQSWLFVNSFVDTGQLKGCLDIVVNALHFSVENCLPKRWTVFSLFLLLAYKCTLKQPQIFCQASIMEEWKWMKNNGNMKMNKMNQDQEQLRIKKFSLLSLGLSHLDWCRSTQSKVERTTVYNIWHLSRYCLDFARYQN